MPREKSDMDLQSLTLNDLHPLPLKELAAICLSNCRHLAGDNDLQQAADLNKTLDTADAVLQSRAIGDELHAPAEALYRLAATTAARHRIQKAAKTERQASIGTILYSTIDCIADLDRDPDAALMSAMLALRTCGKLDDLSFTANIKQELILLVETHTR
ncbi:hypothetical protein GYB59_14635 [bacterium]|nr:hypothetical protein [bacterium]